MDPLDDYCLQRVLLLGRRHAPALRGVCRLWRRLVDARAGAPCTLAELAGDGHLALLEWVRDERAGRKNVGVAFSLEVLRDMATSAAQKGRANVVRFCLQHWRNNHGSIASRKKADPARIAHWGEKLPDCALSAAALGGHEGVVLLCKEEGGASDFNEAMRGAARGGHEGLVRLCREWGANDFNSAMAQAARGGHEGLVLLCKAWGATKFYLAMRRAARGGHEGLVRLCREWGADDIHRDDIEWAMQKAARGGHEGVVRLCKAWGAVEFRFALIEAAYGGHEGVARLCVEWGGDNYDVSPARDEHRSDVWGRSYFDFIIMEAAYFDCGDALRICLAWGAATISEAKALAAKYRLTCTNRRDNAAPTEAESASWRVHQESVIAIMRLIARVLEERPRK